MFGAPFWAPLLLSLAVVTAEGNIGCLFSKGLCLESLEWCYDDLAFGRCLPSHGQLDEEELFRSPLNTDELSTLSARVATLDASGYGWGDPYTQCDLQGLLWGLRQGVPVPSSACNHLRSHEPSVQQAVEPYVWDGENGLPAIPEEEFGRDVMQGAPIARVRFTPSQGGRGSEFADEVYYPPADGNRHKKDNGDIFGFIPAEQLTTPELLPEVSYLNNLNLSPQQIRYLTKPENKNYLRNMLTKFSDDPLNELNGISVNNGNLYNTEEYDENMIREWLERQDMDKLKAALEELRQISISDIDEMSTAEYMTKNHLPLRFSRQYNTPERFSQGTETDLDVSTDYNEEAPIVYDNGYYADVEIPSSNLMSLSSRLNLGERDVDNSNFVQQADGYIKSNELPNDNVGSAGVYTEGGLVYVPETGDGEYNTPSLLNTLLSGHGSSNQWLGFKRRERLDVKKPGPLSGPPPDAHVIPDGHVQSVPGVISRQPQKKELAHSDHMHAPHAVDTAYAYVIVKDSLHSWRIGARLVQALTEVLELPQTALLYPRVDDHEVSFLVNESAGTNASIVAHKIMTEEVLSSLRNQYNVVVTGAGVGDKTKLPIFIDPIDSNKAQFGGHIAGFLLGGIGGALLVSIGALILVRRHSRAKDKLGELSGPESASSKDYQDLCRARMAAKGPGATDSSQPGNTTGTRIASLSRESDNNSPSSRSSTSSWSEEPALSNMDISTGHMVLSYMEDHLRNKGRLDREWGALCRYEAEPGARSAATDPAAIPFNRPGAPLPYDHSRVVLNHLSNEVGLDYINASTISDHDPRAPLYVAAQGPLENTSSHFWQMVWEQGAVVMVMLCRLTENGEPMCHRYWPEEGSEVYHIYEVHLVSEHIWCDDYLVRSFYLKNLRTGETRTVTQFHFLSWPINGVPSSPRALLEFRRKVNKSYRGRSCPIVVHGSGGSGRTGTYILLDMVLARMAKGAREIDIAATLEHIRDQRADMVATRGQFEFVLMAVAEEVHAILKALPANMQQEKKDKEKEKDTKDATKDSTKDINKDTQKDELKDAPKDVLIKDPTKDVEKQ